MITGRIPRVGVIGNGAIGENVIKYLLESKQCELSGVLVRVPVDDTSALPLETDFERFLHMDHDVVIECAGQAALREYAVRILEQGVDLVPASVGVLADDQFCASVLRSARLHNACVRIPSGAIVGIDGLAAARVVGIDSVLYRGTMPPGGLRNFEPSQPVTDRVLAFSGTARDAVSRFPKNANLTATIALASVGFDKTAVELYVDPAVTNNLHELQASGDFGEFRVAVSGRRISEQSPSSRIVPGSIAHAALGGNYFPLDL